MNIIVDAFGGDNAPLEIIKGCVEAVAEYNINVTLTGDETKIKNIFSENSLSMNNIDICHCMCTCLCNTTAIFISHDNNILHT